MNYGSMPEPKRAILSPLRMSRRSEADLRTIEPQMSYWIDKERQTAVAEFTAYVYAEHIDKLTFRKPATFIDAVKHFKVLPAWVLRRMKPAKYEETVVDVRRYHPQVMVVRGAGPIHLAELTPPQPPTEAKEAAKDE